jgi:hypothetical protein
MTKFVALLRAINVGGTEARHYPMDPPDPIEAIQFRMEPRGLTGKDLESIIGTRARVRRAGRRREQRAPAIIAGLAPAVHALKAALPKTWMPGTRPLSQMSLSPPVQFRQCP